MNTSAFDPDSAASIVDILRHRAARQPDQLAYTFLEDGEAIGGQLTYGQLDRAARAVAAVLQRCTRPGDRVLLTYPQGLDFVASFFGCLYSGLIAIPAPLPERGRLRRTLDRLRAIADDADARFILTTSSSLPFFEELAAAEGAPQFAERLATDGFALDAATEYVSFEPQADALAYLQYTSGSTTYPRGVMVGHHNLIVNSMAISRASPYGADCRTVTWLPYFHDYGLVEGLLQPLFSGFPVWFFSPAAFVERPLRWLSAISRFRATHSQAPNFAFAMAVAKTTAAERRGLDLSSWRAAGNGSEPIHAVTARQFIETFEPCGFRPTAFCPVYGLAEATLIVSYKRADRPPTLTGRDPQIGAATVGCGQVLDNLRVEIVDPATHLRRSPGTEGEIWVAGPSVAVGYWNRAAETSETFNARLADSGDGPFLRTGDLGYLLDGELFVCGRIKDLVIIHGLNHYPQDIEETVERCHSALRAGGTAAFSIDVEDEERLVIVAESKADAHCAAGIAATIREQVALHHDLAVHEIVFVAPGELPKTSSGKKQRSVCRQQYLSGSFLSAGATNGGRSAAPSRSLVRPDDASQTLAPCAKEISDWLRKQVAAIVGLAPDSVDVRQSFARYGLVSLGVIELVSQLQSWLGRKLSPTLVYSYPTPAALAAHLAGDSPISTAGWASDRESRSPPPELDGDRRALSDDKIEYQSNSSGEPIAIVGMACRLPGANSPGEFWDNLCHGKAALRKVPAERWSSRDFYDPQPRQPGKSISKWGGFLEQIEQFDARFFGVSPYESERMDPQQRLLLEVAWEALEQAGLAGKAVTGTDAGVFVGVILSEYFRRVASDLSRLGGHASTGNFLSITANRLSYFLNLKGPSLAVDTACSSSLVAIHLAVQSLRAGECSLAIAGGAQVLLDPDVWVDYSQAGMLAPDGLCRSFDDRATGFVRGEGVTLFVLKRLSDALCDGHIIHAVIRATAVNQDGHTNGLTAPNGAAQADLLRRAYLAAGVPLESIGYIEAHGTGTALGDPIEVEALTRVFSAAQRDQFCALGSVKPNIGHLEPAAGAAGLLKATLAIVHDKLPPTLNLAVPNRHLTLESGPFFLLDRVRSWANSAGPRRAGVSSFGFGGTNAHVVLEQAPRFASDERDAEPQLNLFVLSARSETALQKLVERFLQVDIAEGELADWCYTLQIGRAHFAHRLAIEARTVDELRDKLSLVAKNSAHSSAAGIYRSSPNIAEGSKGASATPSSAPVPPATHEGAVQSSSIANRYVAGDDVDWSTLHVGRSRRRVPAPTYPFERQRYWLDDKSPDRKGASDPLPTSSLDNVAEALPSTAHTRTTIERLLQSCVGEVLGLPVSEVGLSINVQELGLNSILATKAAATVSRRSGVELEAIEFFLQPTLGRLAMHLALLPEWQALIPAHDGDAIESPVAADSPPTAPAAQHAPGHLTGARTIAADEVPQFANSVERDAAIDSVTRSRDIAVIGLSCRFPGADSPEVFWKNLLAAHDAVGPLPNARHYDAGLPGELDADLPAVWRHGGFLEDVAGFDPALFALSPYEARRMDPQQRLFLECAWQTLERAGYAPTRLADRHVGVFAGVAPSDYARLWDRQPGNVDPHFGAGTSLAMVANRTSYLLNLVGPSISIDTACSGSLVAVALACQSLRAGECKMALAGGVNLILVSELSESLARGGMLSPRGRSCSFDDRADGYVRGEGVGIVLLKPLSQAVVDGDQVLAVIKGLAVNHDGHDKPGLTAPNVESQVELLRAAYADADVDPCLITYLEAHGTGTALGDPIELTALQRVCGAGRVGGSCALGAVKSSVGHLEAAAGIAGLIKTVLALHWRTLPPSLHCAVPNRRFDWATSAFHLLDRPRVWTAQRRLAGVSAFGFGGANVHMVLEAAPTTSRKSIAPAVSAMQSAAHISLQRLVSQGPAELFVLSAKSESALRDLIERYLNFLNVPGGPALTDLCFTAKSGRAALDYRLAIVARYRDQLADRLRCLRDWDQREHLQGSLVFYAVPSRGSPSGSGHDAQIKTVVDAWRARCAVTAPFVLEALRLCVSGSLWDAQLRSIADEQISVAQSDDSASSDLSEDAAVSFWCNLGQLFVWGAEIDWKRVYAGSSGRRVLLPTYPFERRRFWLDTASGIDHSARYTGQAELPVRPAHGAGLLPIKHRDAGGPAGASQPRVGQYDLITQLIELLADALEAEPSNLDPRRPVVEMGVDSILAVNLARWLSGALGRAVSPTILFEAGSIVGLAERLQSQPDAAERLAASRSSKDVLNTPKELPATGASVALMSSESQAAQTKSGIVQGNSADSAGPANAEPIAVIGVGIRVPGATTLNELWSLVRAKRDLVKAVPRERWELLSANDEEMRNAVAAGEFAAALLPDLDWFDPQFFRLSPREAEEMDPQQRLLLETTWEALESAGYAGGALAGTATGVFVGGMASEYLPRLLAMPERLGAYAATGNTLSILANRLSYLLNLRGPCLALDTACSSSLVALWLAIESLRRGDCAAALVAGAQAGLAPLHFKLMQRFGGLSPRGRCRPFAQGADGYALGEGVGVVLLKPLDRAIAARDHVLAVIRGAAINHGGQSAGLTVPNPAAQAEVVRAALSDAKLTADSISLVEAHGTGTALGDPLEVQGLLEAYRSATGKSQFCAIGSIKGNIGHLEPAAGILGLIKLIAALSAQELPPTLHVDEPNRSISFEATPFYVADRARRWSSPANTPRRAGLSSFGYGGSNAHVILEEAPTSSRAATRNTPAHSMSLLALSAKSVDALAKLAERFARHLETTSQQWVDICWTAATGRPHWPARLAVVADDPNTAARQLRAYCQLNATELKVSGDQLPSLEAGLRIGAAEPGVVARRRSSLRQLLDGTTAEERSAFALCCPTFDDSSASVNVEQDESTAIASIMRDERGGRSLCEALAEAYALGHELQWERIFASVVPRRVPLPTYPFERQRLWRDLSIKVGEATVRPTVPSSDVSGWYEPDAQLLPWLHEVQWRAAPRGTSRRPAIGLWLVFDDESAVGSELTEKLQAAGSRVVRVRPRAEDARGEIDWHTSTEASTEVDPLSRESYDRLLTAVGQGNREPLAGVIHLWSQHRSVNNSIRGIATPRPATTNDKAWRLAVNSGLRLLQAMAAANALPLSGTWFVTRAAQAVDATQLADPVSAALWGLVRAADRERGDLQLRLRDLTDNPGPSDARNIFDDLCDAAPVFESVWRETRRLVPGMSPYLPAKDHRQAASFDPSGVYLITGGLGAIGLAVAESLVERGGRRLVLVSRRGLDETRANSTFSAIAAMRAQGATIWTPSVDVRDPDAIERLFAEVRNQLGPVRGIVHAAGVLADRLLPNVTPDDFERVMAPKLLGAANLLAAIAAEPLEFFVAISSLAAHVGNTGQIAYTAVSSYFAAWLESIRGRYASAPICIVDLGPWGESGMAVRAASGTTLNSKMLAPSLEPLAGPRSAAIEFWRQRGLEPIPPRLGCRVITLVASNLQPRLAAFAEKLATDSAARTEEATFRPLCDIARGSDHARLAIAASPDEQPGDEPNAIASVQRGLEQIIAKAAADCLRLSAAQIDHEREFREHGLDSLMADEMVRRLRQQLQVPELHIGDLFAQPSVARLANWLKSKFGDRLADLDASHAFLLAHPSEADDLASLSASTSSTTIGGEFCSERQSTGQRRSASGSARADNEIAIIGFACRFPGAGDAATFGELVHAGRSVVAPIPAARWQAACQFDPHYATAFDNEPPLGGFLRDIDRFDPVFFRISPTEAAQIDPRQRLFLEVAYHAAEHAGYGGQALRGAKCGVFVGTGGEDYYAGMASSHFSEHSAPGGTAAALPGRLAYFLDLRGPALAIDTACSSSLVALHQAVDSLRRRECQYAFVGGVHLHVRLYSYLCLRRMGALSPSGACRPFDRRADGFVPGEGVAVLLIRPLADAQAAGDTVYGVIRGTAVNNDGRSNGLLAPNPQAQIELLHSAWKDAAIEPATISYFESHGTGTPLGDPMEWSAIDEALRGVSTRRQFAGIGSVKSNIGHADAAAGLAGVIKVLQGFSRRELGATCGLSEPNPRFELEHSSLMLMDRVRTWEPTTLDGEALPRRAGVSSFGFTGTNAHVVLEEPPATGQRAIQGGKHVLTLSALDQPTLRKLAADYARYLRANPQIELVDVCFTANTGRAHLSDRAAIVANTPGDCAIALDELTAGNCETTQAVSLDPGGRSSPTLVVAPSDATASLHRRTLDALFITLKERELRRLKSACRGKVADEYLTQQAQDARTASDLDGDREGAVHRAAALLYVLGAIVDWSQIDDYGSARRVALPLYPFRDERYWLALHPTDASDAGDVTVPAIDTAAASPGSARHSVDALLSVPAWTRCDDSKSVKNKVSGRWLIAGVRSALAGHLAGLLQTSGCEVVDLTREERDLDLAEAPDERSSRNTISRYVVHGGGFAGIVHLSVRDGSNTSNNLSASPATHVLDLVRLVQTVQSGDPPAAIQFWIVTAGAQAVTGGSDCVSPLDAAQWGLARVIPRECPQLSTRAVDVSADEAQFQPEALAAQLVSEFSRRTPAIEMAYRDSHRFVLTRRLPNDTGPMECSPLRMHGTYLITGGLGGIGLALASWLAEDFQARLVLVSRTPLPPRRSWPALLATDRTDRRLRDKLQKLMQLEASGSEVIVVRGDVAATETLSRAGYLARTRFQEINGVFHAAGIVQKRSLRDVTAASLSDALHAKVRGGQALIELARRDKFDFVLFFSSIAGVDGNVFQAEYSAANRTLDALAASARADGLPVQSIAWDLWRDTGMGRGMAALASQRGQPGLDPQVALAAVERILSLDCAEVVVRAPTGNIGDAVSAEITTPVDAAPTTHRGQIEPRVELPLGTAAPATRAELGVRLRRALRDEVAATLGLPVDRIKSRQSLPDLGLDSLLAVRLMRRLSQATGQRLSATMPFDFASIELLALHLETSLPDSATAAWLGPLDLASQPAANGHGHEPHDEGVLELQSGRRIKLLASRGLTWPG